MGVEVDVQTQNFRLREYIVHLPNIYYITQSDGSKAINVFNLLLLHLWFFLMNIRYFNRSRKLPMV